MNLPGRSAATLSALERVVTDCQVFRFPHVCLVRIVQDDDLRRPKAAEWSGSPLGELAPEASEGEERKMAGFIIFLPATVPILPICPVTPISPVQKFQDSRYPFGYMI